MKRFIDFLKPKPSSELLIITQNSDASIANKNNLISFSDSRRFTSIAISSILNKGIQSNSVKISSSDAEKFSEKVTDLAYSEKFLNEFSNEIGLPKADESENEFVIRAKNTMTNLLRKKLEK